MRISEEITGDNKDGYRTLILQEISCETLKEQTTMQRLVLSPSSPCLMPGCFVTVSENRWDGKEYHSASHLLLYHQ